MSGSQIIWKYTLTSESKGDNLRSKRRYEKGDLVLDNWTILPYTGTTMMTNLTDINDFDDLQAEDHPQEDFFSEEKQDLEDFGMWPDTFRRVL